MDNNFKVGDKFTIKSEVFSSFAVVYNDSTFDKVYTAAAVGDEAAPGEPGAVNFIDDVGDPVYSGCHHLDKIGANE